MLAYNFKCCAVITMTIADCQLAESGWAVLRVLDMGSGDCRAEPCQVDSTAVTPLPVQMMINPTMQSVRVHIYIYTTLNVECMHLTQRQPGMMMNKRWLA
jgi:hypothetical protein